VERVRRYYNSAVALVCRDKEMHFKGVQKQNILQSFKEGCSIHCLQESKQVTMWLVSAVSQYTRIVLSIATCAGTVHSLPTALQP
jgi:hypothetical protein